MAKAYFVTGTDTSVGKTTVTCALLAAAKAKGLITLALKPVASGCDETPDGLRNSDALALQKAMTVPLSYAEVNPVALVAPMSPHLAAKAAGRRLTLMQISGFCRGAMLHKADLYLIEGAGGWRVPISDRELLSGLPKQLGLPVILVVGVRLGCINHATLTAEAILKDGVRLAGWVANSRSDGTCHRHHCVILASRNDEKYAKNVPSFFSNLYGSGFVQELAVLEPHTMRFMR